MVHPVLFELYEDGTLTEWCSSETSSDNHAHSMLKKKIAFNSEKECAKFNLKI
jgi:hypothetical protein